MLQTWSRWTNWMYTFNLILVTVIQTQEIVRSSNHRHSPSTDQADTDQTLPEEPWNVHLCNNRPQNVWQSPPRFRTNLHTRDNQRGHIQQTQYHTIHHRIWSTRIFLYFFILRHTTSNKLCNDDEQQQEVYGEMLNRTNGATLDCAQRRAKAKFRMKTARHSQVMPVGGR